MAMFYLLWEFLVIYDYNYLKAESNVSLLSAFAYFSI